MFQNVVADDAVEGCRGQVERVLFHVGDDDAVESSACHSSAVSDQFHPRHIDANAGLFTHSLELGAEATLSATDFQHLPRVVWDERQHLPSGGFVIVDGFVNPFWHLGNSFVLRL